MKIRTMTKRIFSILLCFAMLLGMTPVMTFADSYSGTCGAEGDGSNLTWSFDTDTGVLTITGSGEMKDYFDSQHRPWNYFRTRIASVEIGDSVTNIGRDAFYGCSNLTSINIPEGVMSIGHFAFFDCSSLISINIPDSVMSIGASVFTRCSSLTSITIPDSVTSIDGNTFEDCTSLTSITIPDSVTTIGYMMFFGCSSLTSINIPESVTSIGGSAFKGCSSLTSINIPENVTSMGYNVFEKCENLESVTISGNVTILGDQVFDGCVNLTNITIPNGVTSIRYRAFYRCSSLTSIDIPDSVTSIASEAFCMCSSLSSINMSENLTTIGNGAFSSCSSLTSINIPEGVTSIGGSAFKGCSSLTSINIPESVTSIGGGAFTGCSSLTSMNIPEGVTSMSNGVFYGCSSLTSMNIPEGVTSIGNSAFYGCSALKSIIIPEGVTSIGDSAFENCSSLTSINIPEGVTSIADRTFYSCKSLTNITIPTRVTSIGIKAFSYCSSLASINVPDGVTNINESTFEGCSSLTSINIPEGVTNIGNSAFSCCSSLTSITILGGITSISERMFKGCSSLVSIAIPEGVTIISMNAFEGCKSLMSITMPDSMTIISNKAFAYCSSLMSVNLPDGITTIGSEAFLACSSLTNIVIPASMTSIRASAFAYCSGLTSVTIPEGVTTIDYCAFADCVNLAVITIPDSVTSIDTWAFSQCNKLTIYGSVGSYAQTYAKDKRIPFRELFSEAKVTDVIPNSNPVSVGEKVKFTVETSTAAYGVHLYVKENGNIYDLGATTVADSQTAATKHFSVEYTFNSTGLVEDGINVTNTRRVYAYPIDANNNVIADDSVGDYCDITVTPASHTLGDFTVNDSEAVLGEDATISWSGALAETDDTVYYNVYIIAKTGTILLTPAKITSRSITVDSSIINELGTGTTYTVMVIATAANHGQKQVTADIRITAKAEFTDSVKPLINPIVSSADPIIYGTSVTFSAAASDDTALEKVEVFVDGSLVKTIATTDPYTGISYTTDSLPEGIHTVLVKAYDAAGNYNSSSRDFTVKKNSSGIVYDVTLSEYDFNAGSYITFTVKTSVDTAKIRLLDGSYAFSVRDSGYTDSEGYRFWTFEQYIGTVGTDRTLKVESYSDGWTGNYSTTAPFTVRKCTDNVGEFDIVSPDSGSEHQINTALTVTWSDPEIEPDRYVVNVTGIPADSDLISIDGNTAVIDGSAFDKYGTYAITVTAQKEGYNQTEAYINVTVGCLHKDRKQIGVMLGAESYYSDSMHKVTVIPKYICNTCGGTFTDAFEAQTEYYEHNHDVGLDNNGWLCDCGYVYSGSYVPWTGYLQSKYKEKAYNRVMADGELTNWDGISRVYPDDNITVVGTKFDAFLIQYSLANGGKKTRFIDRTLIDRTEYGGRTIVYVSIDGIDLRCVQEENGVLYAAAYDFATALNGSCSFVANDKLNCRMRVYDPVIAKNYYWAIDLRNYGAEGNWKNIDAYTDESLTKLEKADFAGAYVYGDDINISINGVLELLRYNSVGDHAYSKKQIDYELIKTVQAIRDTDIMFNSVYAKMNNGMLLGEYTTYLYSISKFDPEGFGKAVIDNTYLANADAISSLKQALVMRRTEEHDNEAGKHLEFITTLFDEIVDALGELGSGTDSNMSMADQLIDFDLQAEIDELVSINSRTAKEDEVLSTLLNLKASWSAEMNAFSSKLDKVNFALDTIDFTGKALSRMYTAYVLVQNYDDNMKYLNELINNSTDEYTRQVYTALRDTLKLSYCDSENNSGILNKYLSDTDNVGIFIDYCYDVVDYYNSANDAQSIMEIAKNSLKGGKGKTAANPLLLIHTAVTYAADSVFKGQDLYDAAANLYLAKDAIPSMEDDLNNAIAKYRNNPESEDAHEVLRLTAVFLAQYRITALDYCKAYVDSLVIENYFFYNEYQFDIEKIENEKSKIEDLMNSLK